MYPLIVLVVLTALVCAVQSLMLVTVNRRLQLHAELLWQVQRAGVPADALPAGARPAPFRVLDTGGAEVTGTGWTAATLVAFLSPACGSCRHLRRELAEVAAGWPGGRPNVVVVVTGPAARAAFARRLLPVARVVVDTDETVRAAFGVRGFPALFVVGPTGELSWTGLHADSLPGVAEPV